MLALWRYFHSLFNFQLAAAAGNGEHSIRCRKKTVLRSFSSVIVEWKNRYRVLTYRFMISWPKRQKDWTIFFFALSHWAYSAHMWWTSNGVRLEILRRNPELMWPPLIVWDNSKYGNGDVVTSCTWCVNHNNNNTSYSFIRSVSLCWWLTVCARTIDISIHWRW